MKAFLPLITLSLITACAARGYTPTQSQPIYVVSHGWHTGFIVPADNIQTRIPRLKARFGATPFIEFGWGDKGFYQAKEITTGLTLRALFWSPGSTIHAVAVPENVHGYFANSAIATVCLNDSEYAAFIGFIADSFYKTPQGEVLELRRGIYGDSQFYEGVGRYSIFNTCNKWTAKGLQQAGLDIIPAFSLTAGSIMGYLQEQNQTCSTSLKHSGL